MIFNIFKFIFFVLFFIFFHTYSVNASIPAGSSDFNSSSQKERKQHIESIIKRAQEKENITYSKLIDHKPTEAQSALLMRVINMLSRNHYIGSKIYENKKFLKKASLENLLYHIDPYKNYISQKNINHLKKHLEDYHKVLSGDLTPAFTIYYYLMRVKFKRLESALKFLEEDKPILTGSYFFDRSQGDFFKTEEEAELFWKKKVSFLYSSLKEDEDSLSKKEKKKKEKSEEKYKNDLFKRDTKNPKEKTKSNYQRSMYSIYRDMLPDKAFEVIVTSIAESFDPHSSYFSPEDSSEFQINIDLHLTGIGTSLIFSSDHADIDEVIKGGPADLSGLLEKGDKILAVKEGDASSDNPYVYVSDCSSREFIFLIRGEDGKKVTLQISPKNSSDYSIKEVTIVRGRVYLATNAAKLDIKTSNLTGKKVALISIPSFYDNLSSEVAGFLKSIKDQNISSVLLDLRNNRGGLLSESIYLTSLFIGKKTVVYVDSLNAEPVAHKGISDAVYNGSLAVLVNRYSASASEIFAAAIQDYNRGVILGSNSFGKGTVQSFMSLDRLYDSSQESGSIKLTTSVFYRVNGLSTQILGVMPDIVMPSFIDASSVGESHRDRSIKAKVLHNLEPVDKFKALDSSIYSKLSLGYLGRSRSPNYKKYTSITQQSIFYNNDLSVSFLDPSFREEQYSKAESLALDLFNLSQKMKNKKQVATYDDIEADRKYKYHDFLLLESIEIVSHLDKLSAKK